MSNVLIDDQRTKEFVESQYGQRVDLVAKTYYDGIHVLKTVVVETLFLDHDLGCYDDDGRELTGYNVMLFLEEYPEYLPKSIVLVTSNPVGRQKMQTVIDKLYKKENI